MMQIVFWLLITLAAVQLLAIISVGSALQGYLKSDVFKWKFIKAQEKKDQQNGSKQKLLSTLFVGVLIPSLLLGNDGGESKPLTMDVTPTLLYSLTALNIFFLFVLRYLIQLYFKMVRIDKTESELLEAKKSRRKTHFNWKRALTDAVPLEEEYKVATDHEYDGIRELDNNLPPWWKWGFYISIVTAVIYLTHYHVLKTGDLSAERYEKEMVAAQEAVDQYLKDQALNVDEHSVTMLTEAKELSAGKNLFNSYCKVCHGGNGEGLVGPNLTDAYWLYGGKINDVFKTIKYGAKNGMKSWKDELNPVQIQQVSSYIKSLEGTNPANAKEPQGELYQEKVTPAPTDSSQTAQTNP